MFFRKSFQLKKFTLYILLLAIFGCKEDRTTRNPYLGEVHFNYSINLNFPLYNALKTPMNTVFVPYGGIKGFFVTYTGSGYYAWEAACPNHSINTCQRLHCAKKISNENLFERCDDEDTAHSYLFLQCPCDQTVYSLVNGSPIAISGGERVYPLLYYTVSVAGDVLTISN